MTVIQKAFLGIGWLLTVSSPNAQVITDGTLGAIENLRGPVFQIDARLGQQVGGNLFHSFSRFDVNTSETANFTGSESVTNILARVTGGQSSFINGTLRSTIPNANLYLLNPSGILFGEHARLDISGSFHASTADYVDLQDGGRFYTKDVVGNQSILTVAPPSTFGFLEASITIQGSFLKTSEGKTLSLSGGDISVNKGVLFASGGEISIRADKLFIQDSELYAQGFGKGGILTINAPIFAMDNSWLVANSWYGKGGNISISTDRFTLSKNNTIIFSSGLSMNGQPPDISMEKAEQLITGDNPTSFQAFSKLGYLSNRCGNFSKENQSRFIITASDIPQGTPYDLQTHWVLPPRGRRGK